MSVQLCRRIFLLVLILVHWFYWLSNQALMNAEEETISALKAKIILSSIEKL